MALPDRFKCIVTNWDYLYGLCREVAEQIKHSDFRPDIIVALARGGWFPSRVLCDFLGLDDLTSLKIEHYVGTGLAGQGPHIRYPLNGDALAGKPDIIMLDNMSPREIRTCVEIRKLAKVKPLLEASGGITLDNVADYARTGVDMISVGSLTGSVRAIDMSLDIA